MPATSYVEWKIMDKVYRHEFEEENAVVAGAARRYASVFEPPLPEGATLEQEIADFVEKDIAQITKISVRVLVNEKQAAQTDTLQEQAMAEGGLKRKEPVIGVATKATL